jgi:aspartyl-tRNA(Asn)/glutamyl-tRNA(Gln) amidotransferase subunit A
MLGVSAVSRVREALDRAHAAQPALNIFTSIDDEGAMARAEQIDAAIEGGEYAGPLAGVPVGLKDLIDQEGKVTTCGSAFYRQRAAASASSVTRLEGAGAVIIGKTGLHEWAFGFSSENPHFGPVRNPWDPDTSTGGSSGGSGAAVAASITPIGVGTDTGGSVRVPAALCGTFGLKVSWGRIPLDGVFPLVPSVDTVGPLADSVENLALAYRAMSADSEPEPELGRLRIGVPQPWYELSPCDDSVASHFENAIDALRGLGHQVQSIELPDVHPPGLIWDAIAGEVTAVHADFRAQGQPYGEDVAERLDQAEKVTAERSAAASEWQRMIRARFKDAFDTVDLLITPTVPVARKQIGNDLLGEHHYRAVLSWFTAIGNQSLHPALAMPLHGTVSLQAIGQLGSEPRLLAFARTVEDSALVGISPAAGWVT